MFFSVGRRSDKSRLFEPGMYSCYHNENKKCSRELWRCNELAIEGSKEIRTRRRSSIEI